MDKMERQRQIESDSVRDGCLRWCQNTEYRQASDTKPYRNLIGISWRSLADAIRAEQDILKTSKAKLPAWALPLSSLGADGEADLLGRDNGVHHIVDVVFGGVPDMYA